MDWGVWAHSSIILLVGDSDVEYSLVVMNVGRFIVDQAAGLEYSRKILERVLATCSLGVYSLVVQVHVAATRFMVVCASKSRYPPEV